MFRIFRLALAATATVVFALPWPAFAGWEAVKPDLVITSLTGSAYYSNYVQVTVKNVGTVGAGPCTLRLVIPVGIAPLLKYVAVPALSAGEQFHAHVNVTIDVSCYWSVYGIVDIDDVVAEKYENNNGATYDAPPC